MEAHHLLSGWWAQNHRSNSPGYLLDGAGINLSINNYLNNHYSLLLLLFFFLFFMVFSKERIQLFAFNLGSVRNLLGSIWNVSHLFFFCIKSNYPGTMLQTSIDKLIKMPEYINTIDVKTICCNCWKIKLLFWFLFSQIYFISLGYRKYISHKERD